MNFKSGRGARAVPDREVLIFARALLSEYSRSKLLIKSFDMALGSSSSAFQEQLEPLARMLYLSRTADKSAVEKLHNRNFSELFGIVSFGAESGSNICEALGLFVSRLEREIKLKNKLKSKIGGTQTLTRMGLCVFFPLFCGISSVILQSSSGLAGDASQASSTLLLISAAYAPIMLFISAEFAHPESLPGRNLFGILPYAAASASIMYLVPGLLSHIL
jgi:hypothetical protein